MTATTIRTLFARDPDFIPAGMVPPCREVDPELFFPVLGDKYEEAREVCQTCPLVQPCGQWAIDTNERFGMWGALTPEERSTQRWLRALTS